MTNTVINIDTIDGVILGADDSLTLLANGSIVNQSATIDGSSNSGGSVAIQGYVDVGGIWLAAEGSVSIGATGTFVGHDEAAILLGVNDTLDQFNGLNAVLNEGTIRSTQNGIEVYGNSNSLINSGRIFAAETAITTHLDLISATGSAIFNSGMILSSSGYAARLQNDGDRLTNSGSLISASNLAVTLEGDDQTIVNMGVIQGKLGAISVSGGECSIFNEGDIVTAENFLTGEGGTAITLTETNTDGIIGNTGLIHGTLVGIKYMGVGQLIVTNSGTIEGVFAGVVSAAFFDAGVGATGDTAISNSGTISGLVASVALGDGDDYVINTGVLDGAVMLGAGNDTIDTRHGTISGASVGIGDAGGILGGDGSDTYLIGDASILLVEEAGVVGDEDTVGSTVSYQLGDNFEVLTLMGHQSIDGTGNVAANTINGNSGDNRLSGRVGADRLVGASGDDLLLGGRGNDKLIGGHGDDSLIGGDQKDKMGGGEGFDCFIFQSASNTGNTEATADVIFDFVSGSDLIDLSLIDAITTSVSGNEAFTFIGSESFSGVAGQLCYVALSPNTLVQFDLDGDSVADGIIVLNGIITLVEADFVL
jgi:serralysin